MADLDSRTQDALNESRILVLGVQVILSFQYSSFLESSFDRLPYSSQYIEVVALGLLIVAFGLFVAPAPNHLLIWSDEESPSLQKFVTIATAIALVPFATAMALDVYVTTERVGHLRPRRDTRRCDLFLRDVLLVRAGSNSRSHQGPSAPIATQE